jgi:hypothetical protein
LAPLCFAEMYSLLLEIYVKYHKENNHLLNAFEVVPCVAMKVVSALNWIERYMEITLNFGDYDFMLLQALNFHLPINFLWFLQC